MSVHKVTPSLPPPIREIELARLLYEREMAAIAQAHDDSSNQYPFVIKPWEHLPAARMSYYLRLAQTAFAYFEANRSAL
jgi:hypothetical protein